MYLILNKKTEILEAIEHSKKDAEKYLGKIIIWQGVPPKLGEKFIDTRTEKEKKLARYKALKDDFILRDILREAGETGLTSEVSAYLTTEIQRIKK